MSRNRRHRSGSAAAVVVVYSIGILLCLLLLVIALRFDDRIVLAAGVLGLVLVCSSAPIAAHLLGAQASGSVDQVLNDRLEELVRTMERLGDQQTLSDDARRVLNRRGERDLLRKAIEEDIVVEDWDAAMILVKELAERFGYRIDAEEFRDRIERARFETVDRRVTAAIASLDAMIGARRWDEARAEAGRISRLYPDSSKCEGLRHRVEKNRTEYKQELERMFLHAAGEDRIDEAMDLLKELDHYLSEAEAEPFKEVARGVIGRARENLGVQFKLAVQDKQWQTANIVGERILKEFPNSRMAEEIRGVIEGIRERVATTA